jgi:hypothetical protein
MKRQKRQETYGDNRVYKIGRVTEKSVWEELLRGT